MPPLLAAIPVLLGAISTAFGAVSTFLAGALGAIGLHISAALIGKLLILGIAIVSSLLLNRPKPQYASPTQITIDPRQPRQIAVGRVATGGSSVYAFTCKNGSSTPNDYLVRIICISDYPCSKLVGVVAGNIALTFDTDPSGSGPFGGQVGAGCQNFFYDAHHRPHMWLKVYLGVLSGAVADPWTVANEPNGLWDTTCKGTGLCYAIAAYAYDKTGASFPGGEPSLTFIMNGAPVYDQRYDSTRSNPTRTGSQRLATPTTWQFVDPASPWYPDYGGNAAMLIQQLLRGFYINGKLIIGAGADDNDLSDAMLLAAYNTCDISMATKYATVYPDFANLEPLYRAGMMLDCSQSVQDNMTTLAQCMDGDVFDRGGQITILPGRAQTPLTPTLTDNDIDWTEEASWQPMAELSTLYNRVLGSFVCETDFFLSRPYPIQEDSTYDTQDGFQIPKNLDFAANTSNAQVQRITYRELLKSRQQGLLAFVGSLWLLQLEQGDWFTLTSARWGFTSKTFTCIKVNLTADWKVAIIAQENDAGIDTWNASTQEVDLTSAAGSSSIPPSDIETDTTLMPLNVRISCVGGTDTIIWRNTFTDPNFLGSYVWRNTSNNFSTATIISPLIEGGLGDNESYADTPGAGTFWWWVQSIDTLGNTAVAGPVQCVDVSAYNICGGIGPLFVLDYLGNFYWDGATTITLATAMADTAPYRSGHGFELDWYNPRPAGPWGAGGEPNSWGSNTEIISSNIQATLATRNYTIIARIVIAPSTLDTNVDGWPFELLMQNDDGTYNGFMRLYGPNESAADTTHIGGESKETFVSGTISWARSPSSAELEPMGSSGGMANLVAIFSPPYDSFSFDGLTNEHLTETGALGGMTISPTKFFLSGGYNPLTGTVPGGAIYVTELIAYPIVDDTCASGSSEIPPGAPTLSLSWPGANTGPTATWTSGGTTDHFRVWRNSSNTLVGATDISGSLPNTTTTYGPDTGRTNTTVYWYFVVAYDASEAQSTASNPRAAWFWDTAATSGTNPAGSSGNTYGVVAQSFNQPDDGSSGAIWDLTHYTFTSSSGGTPEAVFLGSPPPPPGNAWIIHEGVGINAVLHDNATLSGGSGLSYLGGDTIYYNGSHSDDYHTYPVDAFSAGNYSDNSYVGSTGFVIIYLTSVAGDYNTDNGQSHSSTSYFSAGSYSGRVTWVSG